MLKKIIKFNYCFLSLQITYFITSIIIYRRFEFVVFFLFFGTFAFIVYNAIVQSVADHHIQKNTEYLNLHRHFKYSAFPWDDFLMYKKAKLLKDTTAITILKQRFVITCIYLLFLVTMLLLIFVYHHNNIHT